MAEKETEKKGAVTTAPKTSQGEASQQTTKAKLVDHIVTELDLKHNPELVEKGVKAGDKVQIPADAKANADARAKMEQAKADKAKAEQAKADQTNAEQAKAEQVKAEQAKAEQAKADKAKADQANADQANADQAKTDQAKAKQGKYVVSSSFADRNDYSKIWNEGDDVSHFDEDRLNVCIERGLVKKA